MQLRAAILLLVLAICVQCLPIEPKFRQMSLEAQESQTNTETEIQAISSRIAFLEKLNKLTYDTTLFTRKLRWLLRRSLSEKPTVAEVVQLMNKELELSQAQAAVAVEGVADELKLEVKQGIIALKAGLAFIEDNYQAGSNPEADAIISKIKANISALEARFGKKTGTTTSTTGAEQPPAEASTAPPVETPPSEQSSTAPSAPPVEQSTAEAPPAEASTASAPTEASTASAPTEAASSTASAAAPAAESSTAATGGGSLIGSETATQASTTAAAGAGAAASSTTEVTPSEAASSTAAAPAAGTAPVGGTASAATAEAATAVPTVTLEATGVFNATNDTSSTGEGGSLAESPLSTASAFF